VQRAVAEVVEPAECVASVAFVDGFPNRGAGVGFVLEPLVLFVLACILGGAAPVAGGRVGVVDVVGAARPVGSVRPVRWFAVCWLQQM
jgi:hypothetical protein